ncbi:diguanylate cyclase [Pseudoduganella sp. LjRoot289]|uniref:ligand-binding sensor domain-containing diguanylate cyclase n=1 Tax=Pseudoduganella sp. LjRoot289 TaxID=3342314 RepID=UPI003ECC7941
MAPLLAPLVVLLLPALAAAQQMPLRYFGQQEGLANLAVTALARDGAGYQWVGTENGLFRYDGAGFQRYGQAEGLSDPLVTAVLVDHEDKLWVGSYNGLFLKVGEGLQPVLLEDGRKIGVRPSQSLVAGPGGSRYLVSGQRVHRLTLRDGRARLQPVFSEQQIAQHAVLAEIASVHADKDASLWLGCGQSLCQSGAAGVTVWGPAQGVPADSWRAIVRDRSGQLWARGDHRIAALPSGAKRFVDRTPPGDLLRKTNLRPVLGEDGQGRILSNADVGLLRWDGSRWEHYGSANGLRTAGSLTALQFDQGGGLWMGSRGLGLITWLGYGNWENWTAAQGLPDDVVLSFVRDAAGVLYAGTRSGPARLMPGAQRFIPAAAGVSGDQWSSMVLDGGGQVWGGSYSGVLTRLTGEGEATFHPSRLPLINRLLVDERQRLWLATRDGIAVLDTTKPEQPAHPPEGLVQPGGAEQAGYTSLCRGGGGAIWFQSAQQLLRLDGGGWSRHPIDKAIGGAELSDMSCSADGSLWLGDTSGRLWRATPGKQGLQYRAIDNRLLGGASILGLHEDKRGWLWVGTDAGIAIWNRAQWRFFNQNDGLVWNDTNGSVFYEDTDGSMWIATSNGASHVHRPELLFAPQDLSVRIQAARSDGQPLALGAPWALPWSSASLELNLASPHYQDRSRLRFHYRMAGLESGWAESAVPHVRYAALPPGDYQFEYYVSNANSQSASAVQTHAVRVSPPWWRTVPFYLLSGVLAVLALTLLYRLRIRHLLRRQHYTEQLVRERTRELELSREQLAQRALRDSLTGAWNRGAILDILERALEQALAQQRPLLVILLDLDHFKRVNDTHGHAAGDAVLREAVARLGGAVRLSDAVGRYGGEEFLVLLPGLDEASGHQRVEQLRQAIRCEPIRVSEQESITVTGSFGVIAFEPRRPLASAELIERADQALYRSKENGRDRIEYAADGG